MPAITAADTKSLAYSVLTDAQKHRFGEILSWTFRSLEKSRPLPGNVLQSARRRWLRVQNNSVGIKGFRRFGVLPWSWACGDKPRGLVLVTGPTGSGKSTTLAAMLDKINAEREEHMITIEDPIEFLHNHKKCLVNQREVHRTRTRLPKFAPRRVARRPGRGARSAK